MNDFRKLGLSIGLKANETPDLAVQMSDELSALLGTQIEIYPDAGGTRCRVVVNGKTATSVECTITDVQRAVRGLQR